MRTEVLATTEADFFKTLLDRQEEVQKHLNELAAAKHRHPFLAVKTAKRRRKKQAHAWITKFVVFSCSGAATEYRRERGEGRRREKKVKTRRTCALQSQKTMDVVMLVF